MKSRQPAPTARKTILSLRAAPGAITPVTRVRSTLITGSLDVLRERALLDAYFARLPEACAEPIRNTIAGVWLPVDLAHAHYRACDGLGLSTSDQVAIGRQVGPRIQSTLFGTLIGLAKRAGVTPWTYLGQIDRLYERLLIGGGIALHRLGPKEALVEVYDMPIFDVPYFCNAWRGVNESICELFCTRAYVKLGPDDGRASKMTFTISWAL